MKIMLVNDDGEVLDYREYCEAVEDARCVFPKDDACTIHHLAVDDMCESACHMIKQNVSWKGAKR